MNDEVHWYYDQAGTRQGPIPESQLRALRDQRTITDDTLVWREGMDDWRTLKECQTPLTAALTIPNDVPSSLPVWLSFCGWSTIILGIVSIGSIIGFVTGIILLFCGFSLLRLRTAVLNMVNHNGQPNEAWQPLLSFAKSYTWLMIGIVLSMIFFVLFYTGFISGAMYPK